jgi:hypothetical protein
MRALELRPELALALEVLARVSRALLAALVALLAALGLARLERDSLMRRPSLGLPGV